MLIGYHKLRQTRGGERQKGRKQQEELAFFEPLYFPGGGVKRDYKRGL